MSVGELRIYGPGEISIAWVQVSSTYGATGSVRKSGAGALWSCLRERVDERERSQCSLCVHAVKQT